MIDKKISALIVDDEQEARDLLENLLSGFQEIELISKESNVDDAVKTIIDNPPDIIFLDIEMPGKDGFDLVYEINNYNIKTTVVFVTAYNKYAIKAFKYSAFDYLLKPVDPDVIQQTLNRYKSEKQIDNFFEQLFTNRRYFLASKDLKLNVNLQDAMSDLLFSNGKVKCPDSKNFNSGVYSEPSSVYQRYMRQGIEGKIPDSHRFANHKPSTVSKFSAILNTAKKNKPIDREIKIKFRINKHTIIPLDGNGKSPTLTTLPDDYLHYKEPRILTVREYARIQSFPDWFEFKGKYTTGGKLRTQEIPRYSQIGNAIPPLFGEQSGLVLKQLIS